MPILETLVDVVEPWSTLYSRSTTLSVALTFAHLGAMMIGGGLAIAADRAVLGAGTPADAAARILIADAVGDVHRPVLVALGVSAVSGGLQLAADLESLAVNRIMWVKFGLLMALGVNGLVMLRNEQAVRRVAGSATAFGALRVRAVTSIVLWLAIVLAGVGLMQG
ncbi:MAG: hypothetical protein H7099_16400 [Gemmatimonadaceae bacterium]|nr:hypothetical protein [Gemmatimonadaceae bacterium]